MLLTVTCQCWINVFFYYYIAKPSILNICIILGMFGQSYISVVWLLGSFLGVPYLFKQHETHKLLSPVKEAPFL